MDFYSKAKETLNRLRCVDGVIITQQHILEAVLKEVFESGRQDVLEYNTQLPLPFTPDDSPY